MLEFLNLEPETFGLDINDSSFKILRLKKKHGSLQPVSFAEEKLKKGIVEDGIIKDENAFAKALKEALANVKGEKIRTKYVIASLPEEKSFLQVIQMPKMDEKELKTAVPFEAENYIPLPADQTYLDFKKISPIVNHLDHLDVLIVATEKAIVDSYVSALKKAGLMPVALEPETQAIARVLVKDEISQIPVAIIDFGEDDTDFIVFSGRSIRFTSSITICSAGIAETISEELGISTKEAGHLMAKYGLNSSKNHRARAVSKAMAPVLDKLVVELQKYLDYYAGHDFHDHLKSGSSKKNKVEKIILSGGGANLKGLDEFLKDKLGLEIELGNQWVNFPKILKNKTLSDLDKEFSSFGTVLGLAMRGAESKKP